MHHLTTPPSTFPSTHNTRIMRHTNRRSIIPIMTDGNHRARILTTILPSPALDPRHRRSAAKTLLVPPAALNHHVVKGEAAMRVGFDGRFFGCEPMFKLHIIVIIVSIIAPYTKTPNCKTILHKKQKRKDETHCTVE